MLRFLVQYRHGCCGGGCAPSPFDCLRSERCYWLKMLEELYLIRHAAPDRTTAMLYNVLPGPPLTPEGEREAAQTARWLAGRGLQHLLTSPFARARATAEAAAAEAGLPLTFVDALREGSPGESADQIRARVAE